MPPAPGFRPKLTIVTAKSLCAASGVRPKSPALPKRLSASSKCRSPSSRNASPTSRCNASNQRGNSTNCAISRWLRLDFAGGGAGVHGIDILTGGGIAGATNLDIKRESVSIVLAMRKVERELFIVDEAVWFREWIPD